MITVAWTALVVVLLLVNLLVHEAAHALALRGLGGRIGEAGLGMPLAPRIVVAPTRRRPWRLSLSPWLLGAYVQPDPESEELIAAAGYRDRAWFAGAGVVANLLVGAASAVLLTMLGGQWVWALTSAGIGVAVWFGRKLITAVLPVVGVAALVLLVWWLPGASAAGAPVGPVAVAMLLRAESGTAMVASTLWLSIGLALLNSLPLLPFDGGRVAEAAIDSGLGCRVAQWFRVGTGIATAGLVLSVIVSDVWWLLT